MTSQRTGVDPLVVDLSELIDGQKIQRSSILLLVVGALMLLTDGFDLAVIGYVGPELVKEWQIAPAQLTAVFSAGIVGLFFGAPLLGYVGDLFGRKKAILIGLCTFGGVTLMTMAATSLQQFVVLRFLTGIGLGGLIPNVIALTAEMAPKRLRGMFIAIVNFGVTSGLALPGIVAAILVPRYGWQALLLVGGLLPLVTSLIAFSVVPESIKYLAERGDRNDAIRRLVHVIRPDVSIDPATRFSMATHAAGARGSPKQLFAGGLAMITPVLWIALAANQMVNFFVLSWLPTLLQSAGSSTAEAGVASSMFAIGGLAGGLFITLIVDRLGIIPLVALFTIGVPAVAAIGITNLEPGMFRAIIASAGFCITGINFGMNVALGTIYPTPVRSMGTGWAQAIGRVGSLAAPILGGALLAMHLSMQELLFVPALTLAVGAVACLTLAVLCVRRFGGYRLDEF